jgi:hypothetical protein
MSDVNLLIFGCVVSFIAVAGAYLYLREAFTAEGNPNESEAKRANLVKGELRDVA